MTDKISEFLAESKRVEEAVGCSCWPTPEEYHFVHYGATEPGSAWEHNPDCPVHGTSEWAEGARTALSKLRRALEAVLEEVGELESSDWLRDTVAGGRLRAAIESALTEEESE